MPTTLTWQEVALRLVLTFLAGLMIGFDRGEHGRPAGLRTTLLVCLAASVSMIQANLLMSSVGKAHDSYVVLDLMRLPLGILSGMGFIGAGAILRKENMVLGVTTAATLWFVTVVGLCFGGGQIALGITAVILGMIVLWVLKILENRLLSERRAILVLESSAEAPSEREIIQELAKVGYRVLSTTVTYLVRDQLRAFRFEVQWRERPSEDNRHPPFLPQFASRPGTVKLEWNPVR